MKPRLENEQLAVAHAAHDGARPFLSCRTRLARRFTRYGVATYWLLNLCAPIHPIERNLRRSWAREEVCEAVEVRVVDEGSEHVRQIGRAHV